jgi:hypothetical protein
LSVRSGACPKIYVVVICLKLSKFSLGS